MRRALALAAVVVGAVATPASAAIEPGRLVLRPADVPAGFELQEGASGVRSNAHRAAAYPAGHRPQFARFGRLTGYDAMYLKVRPWATIVSSVDLFRRSEDLDRFTRWWERESRAVSPKPPEVTRVWIGARASVTKDTVRDGSRTRQVTTVGWRHGRVAASVVGVGVAYATVLKLARAQQRRIASALR